ncbi:uncharacterized protein GGS25DRAFT_519464 [Hypoxylon fragiforme]|uniref:uncharacterized protein n=1 Tax=Hypoxylon fragiforme TaxID=63214 RepID=UPI0020C6C630|nr:uncharacterized protein GGS25DRAFT_519464 [Hypoxylon fragiforme]KAI2611167.1 hypothetical protein GGS25DRAFT_519464 [Hypoxylon fragiforme]
MYATRALRMMATRRMMSPIPKEEQSDYVFSIPHENAKYPDINKPAAHTISQRLRKLRQIPAELIPLGVVVVFAVGAAGYSSLRKFKVDKTMRLSRQNRKDEPTEHGEGHH